MLTLKKLNLNDRQNYVDLMNLIEEALTEKSWWLPMLNEELNMSFDKSKALIYGMFDDDQLIAASSLYLDEQSFSNIASLVEKHNKHKICKISRCMVHPEYRGNDYMYKLNCCLIEKAKDLKYNHAICIVHPDNKASIDSFKKLGMTILEKTTIHNNPRNIMNIDLK